MATSKFFSLCRASSSSKLSSLLFLRSHPSPFSVRFRRRFSTTATPYPLYYELVHYRPVRPPDARLPRSSNANDGDTQNPPSASADDPEAPEEAAVMDRSKRKYYRKRQRRMYGGSDSDEEGRRGAPDELVELKPEVIDFPRIHAREEELYFYDAFAYPWEKDKHYRMVYQLEKKYFPQYSLDNAFIDPSAESPPAASAEGGGEKKKGRKSWKAKKVKDGDEERDERALIFFEDNENEKEKPAAKGVTEKKVEEFFKCLRKVPSV